MDLAADGPASHDAGVTWTPPIAATRDPAGAWAAAGGSRLLLAVGLSATAHGAIGAELAAHGWRCHRVDGLAQALQAGTALRVDAVLVSDAALDGNLARGVSMLRAHVGGALIVLAARHDDIDEIMALELGADDYVAAPFHPRRLRARLAAAVRASAAAAPALQSSDGASGTAARAASAHAVPTPAPRLGEGFSLDLSQGLLRSGGREVRLPAAQAAVLALLLEKTGSVASRGELARRVGLPCGESGEPLGRGVDMHLHHLRRRLAEAGIRGITLETVRGLGYALRTAPALHGDDEPPATTDGEGASSRRAPASAARPARLVAVG
jgi:DNA-binding response OmpR family regulator